MSLLRLRVSGEWGSYDIQAVAVEVRSKRNGLSLPTSPSVIFDRFCRLRDVGYAPNSVIKRTRLNVAEVPILEMKEAANCGGLAALNEQRTDSIG